MRDVAAAATAVEAAAVLMSIKGRPFLLSLADFLSFQRVETMLKKSCQECPYLYGLNTSISRMTRYQTLYSQDTASE